MIKVKDLRPLRGRTTTFKLPDLESKQSLCVHIWKGIYLKQANAAVYISPGLCHRICVYLYASGIEYRVNSDMTLHRLDLCNPVCVSCHHVGEPWVASVTHAMCIL